MSIDIKILQSSCCGSGSPIREELEGAANKAGVELNIQEITDISEVIKFGTMTFPSIVIRGDVHDYKKFKTTDDLVNLFLTEKSNAL